MKRLVARLTQSAIARNAFALLGVRMFTFLSSLITIPFLARVLGVEPWGKVVFAQVIGLALVIALDYSFPITATREVAASRDDRNALGSIVSRVLAAKLLLTTVFVAGILVAQPLVPQLRDAGGFLWLALLWAIGTAFVPIFYFQGIEQVPRLLKIDAPLRIAGTASIFLFVRQPGDAWMAIFFPALAGLLVIVASFAMVYREIPFVMPSLRTGLATLRAGFQVFFYRISASIYWLSNTIVLGMVAPFYYVGLFAGPERITRAVINLTDPICQALFPHSTRLARTDRAELARNTTLMTIMLCGVMLVAAVVLYIAAPLVVRIVLGPEFGESVSALRVLAVVLPICGLNMALNFQWMFPLGMDRTMMWITTAGALFHIPLAAMLGSQYHHTGVAIAFAITETCIAATVVIVLLVRGMLPFTLHPFQGHQLSFRKEQP